MIQFFLFAAPVGIGLAFGAKMGLSGLWLGMGTGFLVLVIYYLFLILIYFDWNDIAEIVHKRNVNDRENSFHEFKDSFSKHKQQSHHSLDDMEEKKGLLPKD